MFKRAKEQEAKNTGFSAEEKTKASEQFEKIGGKQIMGAFRVQHAGEPAVTKYILEDGSEAIENDEGQAVQKMPDELSEKVKARRKKK